MPPKKPNAAQLVKEGKLNTANARAERRDVMPASYDPFAAVAPVQPLISASSSTVRFDEVAATRTYYRANPQGEAGIRFDPEAHPITDAHRRRIGARQLDQYTDFDMLIEEERDAALVEQPLEAQKDLQRTLANPQFIASIKGPVTRSGAPSGALQRKAALQRSKALRDQKLLESFQRAATGEDAMDPDFFTRLPGYTAPRKNESATEEDNRMMLDAIDQELREVAEGDDNDDDDDDDNDKDDDLIERRKQLEKERAEIVAAIAKAAEEDAAAERAPLYRDDVTVPLITDLEAHQMLEINPLVALDKSLRTQFFQLAEPSQLWCTLMPLIQQHEHHRRHYNVVELIRAMNVCGAKYDGSIKMRARTRLGKLVDRSFYRSFLTRDGHLSGGHEHCTVTEATRDRDDDEESTTFVLFKFFLVQRTKDNSEVMNGTANAAATTAAASTTTATSITGLTNEEANDIDNVLGEHGAHSQLYKPGLYDADEAYEDIEDDGTDEYGSMHEIRDLQKHFMFSMRLVCVMAPPDCDADSDGYASLDDGDFEPEPQEPEPLSTEQTTQRSSASRRMDEDDNDEEQEEEEEPEDFAAAARREDSAAFTHTDDEKEDAQTKAQRRALERKPFMPFSRLNVTWVDTVRLVGRWKAEDLFQKINSGYYGPLCVRSFMFYASGSKI